MPRLARCFLATGALLLALTFSPAAFADNITTDSDQSDVTAVVNEEIAISATDPSAITLSHFFNPGWSTGHVAVVSTQPGWTISIRDLDETSPGQLDRSSGSGPATLNDTLGVNALVNDPFSLTASNQELLSGAANDDSDVLFTQTLASGEDVLAGDSYQTTVLYSVVAGGSGFDPASYNFVLGVNGPNGMKVQTADQDGSNIHTRLAATEPSDEMAASPDGVHAALARQDSLYLYDLNANTNQQLSFAQVCGWQPVDQNIWPQPVTIYLRPGWDASGDSVRVLCSWGYEEGTQQDYTYIVDGHYIRIHDNEARRVSTDGSSSADSYNLSPANCSQTPWWASIHGDNKYAWHGLAFNPVDNPGGNTLGATGAPAIFTTTQGISSCTSLPTSTTLETFQAPQQLSDNQGHTVTYQPSVSMPRISPDGSSVAWLSQKGSTPSIDCQTWGGNTYCWGVAQWSLNIKPFAGGDLTSYLLPTSLTVWPASNEAVWSADGSSIYASLLDTTNPNIPVASARRYLLSDGSYTTVGLGSQVRWLTAAKN